MTDLFLKIFNISLSAVWIVCGMLAVRLVFRKAPKWVFPLLWGLVGIRLLMPTLPESSVSRVPKTAGHRAAFCGESASPVRRLYRAAPSGKGFWAVEQAAATKDRAKRRIRFILTVFGHKNKHILGKTEIIRIFVITQKQIP